MSENEMLEMLLFPNSKDSCDIEFAKNLINLLSGEKIKYHEDTLIVKMLNCVRDKLIKIKNNSQCCNLIIYKPKLGIDNMPKLEKNQVEQIINFYINKISRILQNKD